MINSIDQVLEDILILYKDFDFFLKNKCKHATKTSAL